MTQNANGQTGKLAIVTGGSRGLGRSMVVNLARQGHDAIFTYHSNKDAANEVTREVEVLGRKAVALQLDTGDTKAFPGFVTELKEALTSGWQRDDFDALINNAGIGIHQPIAQTTEEQFDTLVNIHLKGVYFLTQSLLPVMADGGRIINISSGLARFSLPGFSAYAAMKGGIEVFTRYLAAELGARGITANTVAPGAIETDFAGGSVRDNEGANSHVASVTALGRAGVPEDIGPMIASLISENNRWINAQRIEVSGGMFV